MSNFDNLFNGASDSVESGVNVTGGDHDDSGSWSYQPSYADDGGGASEPAPSAGSVNGKHSAPYRHPDLIVAHAGTTIWIVASEKVADQLWTLGLAATTCPGGLGEWQRDYNYPLRGREVVIIASNGELGRQHAERVARSLVGVAASIRIFQVPGLAEHEDLSDWLDREGDAERLCILAENCPEWVPAADTGSTSDGEAEDEILSPANKRGVAGERIRFYSAAEIAATTSPDVPWIAKPWVVAGAITEIDGKVKAAGKTTLATNLCRHILDGGEFLGEPTRKTKVVYLTEQSRTTFREALRRAELLDREDFRVMFWSETRGEKWEEVVKAAAKECDRVGAKLLVVDTFGQFTGLSGDAENQSGEGLRAIQPLQLVAAEGIGIVIIRHDRKSGGEVGDSARGTSAIPGAVDIVINVRRGEGNSPETVRHLHCLSRFDETPQKLVIELRGGEYVSLGEETNVVFAEARRAILEAVPTTPESAVTFDELRESTGVRKTTAEKVIQQLLDEDLIRRISKGVKGDPYRIWRPIS